MSRRYPEPEQRLWAKVNRDGPIPAGRPELGPCWLWTGGRNPWGYGHIRVNQKKVGTHRYAYELLVGPVPQGLQLDHLCRVRACCNPAHMEPVTRKENILRGEACMAVNARKTHCPQGHELAGENLRLTSVGTWRCVTCVRYFDRIRARRKRAAIAGGPDA